MIHLTIQQLSSFLDGDIGEASVALAQEHFAVCEECSAKLDRLAKQDEALVRILAREPDEALIERLPVELEKRIRSEGPKDLRARVAAADPLPPPPAGPPPPPVQPPYRRPGAAASFDPSPVEVPALKSVASVRTGRPSSAHSWAAAIIIVVIAGSVGAMIFGKELVSYWLDASGSRTTNLPAGVGYTPGTTTGVETPPLEDAGNQSDVDAPGAVPPDPPDAASVRASKPEERAVKPREAASQPEPVNDLEPVADAPPGEDVHSSIESYEAAAAEWEQSLPLLQGDEYQAARFRLAEVRYRAWQLESTKERAARATGAIRAYLVAAPPGPDRETATRWLSEVAETGY